MQTNTYIILGVVSMQHLSSPSTRWMWSVDIAANATETYFWRATPAIIAKLFYRCFFSGGNILAAQIKIGSDAVEMRTSFGFSFMVSPTF